MTVGDELLSDEVRGLLAAPDPDLDHLRALVVKAYNREMGAKVNPRAPSEPDRAAVADWLRQAVLANDQFPGLVGKPPTLRFLLFDGLESKLNWLLQAPCLVCGLRAGFPISIFSVRLSPASQQAQPTAYRKAFRRAVAAGLRDRHLHRYETGALCLRIVYLLSPSRRRRLDVDNLTKGTLDALRGIVFDDDSQIDHLDLVKIRGTGEDEHFGVRIRPTQLNDHERDTFRETFEVRWAGQQSLNLEDFLQD